MNSVRGIVALLVNVVFSSACGEAPDSAGATERPGTAMAAKHGAAPAENPEQAIRTLFPAQLALPMPQPGVAEAMAVTEDAVYFVVDGAVLRAKGQALRALGSPRDARFYDIAASFSGDLISCYTVGDELFIARHDGASWNSVSVGTVGAPAFAAGEATASWRGVIDCNVAFGPDGELFAFFQDELWVDDGVWYYVRLVRESDGKLRGPHGLSEGDTPKALGAEGRLSFFVRDSYGLLRVGEGTSGNPEHDHWLFREDGYHGGFWIWEVARRDSVPTAMVWVESTEQDVVWRAPIQGNVLGASENFATFHNAVTDLKAGESSRGELVVAMTHRLGNDLTNTLTVQTDGQLLELERTAKAQIEVVSLLVDGRDEVHLLTQGHEGWTYRVFTLE